MEESKKPYVQLGGKDGNVFSIIGRVSNALKKAGMPKEAKEFRNKAVSQGSYDDVLALCSEYCDVG